MKKKMIENKKTDFYFGKLLRSMKTVGGSLIFIIVLSACSRDADFRLKEGAESLQSINQQKMNPSILIDGGLEYTNDSIVDLSFNPDGDAVEMFISFDPNCSTGSWEPFKEKKPFELTELNQNATIYVKYKYRRLHQSHCVYDEIVHDDTPPELRFSEKFETPWIKNRDLDISFLARDSVSGIKLIHCDLSGSGNFEPCNEVISLRSMDENRDYYLVVYAEDHAGNSVTKSLNWRSDQTPPEIVFNSTPQAVTNNKNPHFSFTASDSGSGVASYWCRMDDQKDFKKCSNDITFRRLSDGKHQLEIKAIDSVGWSSEVYSYSWTQDRNAPTIEFTNMPSSITKNKEAVFEFLGINNLQEVTSYRCRLDSGSYEPCSSPYRSEKLSDGRHSFSVVGSDQAGNVSSPITYRWQVDTLPPTLAFSRKPDSITSSSRAVFSFFDQDKGSGVKRIQCRLDSGSFKPCDNFSIFTELSSGTHSLMATAEDHAGNPSHPPIEYQWLVDRSKPEITLVSVPDSRSDSNQARFTFDAIDQISGIDKVECLLDGGSFKSCENPMDYNQLSEGDHSFSVRAVDKAGNISLVQSHRWFVDTKGPEIVFVKKPGETVHIGSKAEIHFTLNDQTGVGVKSYECLFNDKPQNCSTDTLYRIPANQYGHNTFQITAFDNLDNRTTEVLNWTNKYELISWQQEFKVEEDRPVDILFVVDNSKSMNEEREHLARKIDGFLHKLEGLDWQVAVISTEIYDKKRNSDKYYQDGRLLSFDAEGKVKILDSTMDVNVAQVLFGERITSIPIDTKGHEQGIYATVRAIERALDGQGENVPNAEFFRKEAHLAVVVLSDEDENSCGVQEINHSGCMEEGVRKEIRYTPAQFLYFISKSFNNEKKITWHSIVIMSGDEDCKVGHAFYGTEYEKLSKLTGYGKPGGAIIGSICDEDYTTMLEDIGQSVKDKHNTIALDCQPSTGEDNNEVGEVLVTHKDVGNTDYESYWENYVVQDQKVIFDELLDPGDYRLKFNCRK